jgi:hypothetical protein
VKRNLINSTESDSEITKDKDSKNPESVEDELKI